MAPTAETWIVIADGAGLRVLEERRRLGPLTERADLAVKSTEDRGQSSAHTGTVTDRSGHGRHGAGETDPAENAEHRFLRAAAKQLDAAALAGAFERLVIIAPPDALGVLRGGLAAATARRIEVCDPHERCREDAETLRDRLRAIRAGT